VIYFIEAVGVGNIKLLGNADAATHLGGLEAHGMAVIEAAEKISGAIHDLAEAVRELANGSTDP
jgi:hypothetical protein